MIVFSKLQHIYARNYTKGYSLIEFHLKLKTRPTTLVIYMAILSLLEWFFWLIPLTNKTGWPAKMFGRFQMVQSIHKRLLASPLNVIIETDLKRDSLEDMYDFEFKISRVFKFIILFTVHPSGIKINTNSNLPLIATITKVKSKMTFNFILLASS